MKREPVDPEVRARGRKHNDEMHDAFEAVIQRLMRVLNKSDPLIAAEIRARHVGGDYPTYRVDLLLKRLKEINDDTIREVYALFKTELREIAKREAAFHQAEIELQFGPIKAVSAFDLNKMVNDSPMLGSKLREWVRGLGKGRYDRMAAAIRLGIAQKKNTSDIIFDIFGVR